MRNMEQTSSEYRRKSPFDSHNEQVVNECTRACPARCILTGLAFVARIQLGWSPVKKTPEKVTPGAGEVTKGMKRREIRLCSARTVLPTSSVFWISYALETTLTKHTRRENFLAFNCDWSGGPVGWTSYIASCPHRRKTWRVKDGHLCAGINQFAYE
jgi:hypothetical protein